MDLSVHQYGIDGIYIQSYSTMTEACIKTGILRTAISNAIKNSGTSGGFQWRKERYSRIEIFDLNAGKNKAKISSQKPIDMYSLDDVYIKSYPSSGHAARDLNVDVSGIRGALTGKYAFSYGFRWRYKEGIHARKHKSKGKKKAPKYSELTIKRRLASIASASARVYLNLGYIKRKNCQVCDQAAQMHHEDYSKKYDVTWLCKPHHIARHAEMRRLGIDPWENVDLKNAKYAK